MTKLTKAQQKRFDEKFGIDAKVMNDVWREQRKIFKQYLAEELSKQKKEIIEELKKTKYDKSITDTLK